MAVAGVDAMWLLPSALNVKVKKFKQARVNGGSNYDPLAGLPHLAIPGERIGDARYSRLGTLTRSGFIHLRVGNGLAAGQPANNQRD